MHGLTQVKMPVAHVVGIACGSAHSLAVTREGAVYTWGRGGDGQLGHGDKADQDVPTYVEALAGIHIVLVAAGGQCSAAVSVTGELYTWGDNRFAQCGQTHVGPAPQQIVTPIRVDYLREHGLRVLSVASGGQHALAVARAINGDTQLYGWGDGSSGALGLGAPLICYPPH